MPCLGGEVLRFTRSLGALSEQRMGWATQDGTGESEKEFILGHSLEIIEPSQNPSEDRRGG